MLIFKQLLISFFVCAFVYAEETIDSEFEFFDYLGTLVEDEGNWVDPIDMESMDVDEAETIPVTTIGEGPELEIKSEEGLKDE